MIARGTPGFSGADLANLVNEAALFAARGNKRLVDMHDFERAKDKIIMGAERRSMVMDEEERKSTAYHESGHALIGKLLPKLDPVHKVTIIPRGRALGVTMSLPEKDKYSYDREFLLNQISMLFGGRIAEEVFMGQQTTGAANDFERATHMARDMVMRYGMSDALGPVVYAEDEGEVFLGRSITRTNNVSSQTLLKIETEIRRIIDEQYAVAKKLIVDNSDKMHAMAKALLEFETIDSDQIDDIIAGRPPRLPKQPAGATARRRRRRPPPAPSRRPRRPDLAQMLSLRGRELDLATPRVMGVVNVTPDSFSDGHGAVDVARAIAHGRALVAEGADIVDIGGESTRPGAHPVSEHDELARVVPVIAALAGDGALVSVDTMKPGVMRAAIDAGAAMVNDVRALRRRGCAGRGRGLRRRRVPDAHAGRSAHDAGRAGVRRRRRRGARVPARARRRRAGRGHRARAHRRRSRLRLRQDAGA